MAAYHAHGSPDARRELDQLCQTWLESISERAEGLDREGLVIGVNRCGLRVMNAQQRWAVVGRKWEQLWQESSRETVRRGLDQARKGEVATFDAVSVSGEGQPHNWHVRILPLRDHHNHPARFVAVSWDDERIDLSARPRTAELLDERESQLAAVIEHCPGALAVFDRQMCCTAASRRWHRVFDVPGPAVGKSYYELFPETPQRLRDMHARCLADAEPRSAPDTLRRRDGRADALHWELYPWRVAGDPIGGLVISAELADAEGATREQLRVSEERLRMAIAGAALGTWSWNLQKAELSGSDTWFGLLGLAPRAAPLTYAEFIAAVQPSDHEAVAHALTRAVRDQLEYRADVQITWPDGSIHCLAMRGRVLRDAQGTATHIEGVAHDVTARKNAERGISDAERRFRQLADALPILFWQGTPQGETVYANKRWRDYFGRTTFNTSQTTELIHPDDLPRVPELALESELVPLRLRRHDGRYLWFACQIAPVRDAAGRIVNTVTASAEIEDLKRTEEALRESRARLETALRAAGMGTWVWHVHEKHVEADAALGQLFGDSPNEAWHITPEEWLARVHPDDRAGLREAWARCQQQGVDLEAEFRLARKDGQYVWLSTKGRIQPNALTHEPDVYGAAVDVTKHKRLEEELRQAQKMEAVGQLAGGIAHDFNNILMVILGQSALTSAQADISESVKAALEEISVAAERAASLTAQLLAFGRRHPLQLKKLDLNEVVSSIHVMLKHVMTENITLMVAADPRPPRLIADPNSLAQVLLNLALNARDAMPNGGQLTIRTSHELLDACRARDIADARPGTWACIEVSDTGTGIPSDVLPRIFEPFFTTKEQGKGSGLGLATVYGIVKQHQGFVSVASSLGRGTTFKVYLPLPAVVSSEPAAERGPIPRTSGRGELVLLVEDADEVRATLAHILEQHNYRAIAVPNALQALELVNSRGSELDLVLSDISLPGPMSGVEFALRVRELYPRLRIILCSGYSPERAEDIERLPDIVFLQKPFRPEQLLAAMRGALRHVSSYTAANAARRV